MDNWGQYSGDEAEALILASGASLRMGTPKAFLPFSGRENFIQRLVSTYINWGCRKVVIVAGVDTFDDLSNSFTGKRVKVVENRFPEAGRFWSVLLGLRETQTPYLFLQNVDNPFTCHCWLSKLFDNRSPGHWTAPEYQGKRGHPVLFGKEVIQNLLMISPETPLLPSPQIPEKILRDELDRFPSLTASVSDPAILININTPWDYEKYFHCPVAETVMQ